MYWFFQKLTFLEETQPLSFGIPSLKRTMEHCLRKSRILKGQTWLHYTFSAKKCTPHPPSPQDPWISHSLCVRVIFKKYFSPGLVFSSRECTPAWPRARTSLQMNENTKTKTSPTLTEKDLAKDCPEVTTVRTTGELLDSPMSTYTAQKIRECKPTRKKNKKNNHTKCCNLDGKTAENILTVCSGVCSANGRNWRSSAD